MLNKKTIAVKHDVKVLINMRMADMTPAELANLQKAMEQILLIRGLRGIISQIGLVHEVSFSDGKNTLSVILTYEGIRSLGIDLNSIFKGCRGREVFEERTDVKNGVLVNLDLYQQVALLRAIIEKKPELADVLGLYNLRGSRNVYEVLSRKGVPKQLGIWWMWTGERHIPEQDNVRNYPEEDIVTLSSLSNLGGYRFFSRVIDYDRRNDYYPDHHNYDGAAVFGAQILIYTFKHLSI